MVHRIALQCHHLVECRLSPCRCYEVVAICLERGHIVVDELALACECAMVRRHHLFQLCKCALAVLQLEIVVLDHSLKCFHFGDLLSRVFVCLLIDLSHYLLLL